jgi:hypothetical protein
VPVRLYDIYRERNASDILTNNKQIRRLRAVCVIVDVIVPNCRSPRQQFPAESPDNVRRLDRGVAKEEFDLLQISAILAAEFRAGPPQIVRPKVLNPEHFRGGLNHAPDCPIA